jgi:hypothetical protein
VNPTTTFGHGTSNYCGLQSLASEASHVIMVPRIRDVSHSVTFFSVGDIDQAFIGNAESITIRDLEKRDVIYSEPFKLTIHTSSELQQRRQELINAFVKVAGCLEAAKEALTDKSDAEKHWNTVLKGHDCSTHDSRKRRQSKHRDQNDEDDEAKQHKDA